MLLERKPEFPLVDIFPNVNSPSELLFLAFWCGETRKTTKIARISQFCQPPKNRWGKRRQGDVHKSERFVERDRRKEIQSKRKETPIGLARCSVLCWLSEGLSLQAPLPSRPNMVVVYKATASDASGRCTSKNHCW